MRRQHPERGIAVLMVVLMLNALVLGVAMGVDAGRAWVTERDLQRTGDVAALDAARHLAAPTGRPEDLVALVEGAAIRSAARNGHHLLPEDIELGHLIGDEWVRIVPGDPSWPPTAVKVTATGATSWLFARGSATTRRSAVAELNPTATIWVGSGLVGLASEDSPLLAAVLSALMGSDSDAELSLVSWSSLADATITLGGLADAAAAAGIDDYLNAQLQIGDHLHLVATALSERGLVEASSSVAQIAEVAASVSALSPVAVGDLLRVDGRDHNAALGAQITGMDLVHGLLLLGASGGPAVEVDTEIGLDPVAVTTASATVVEPPQVATGPVGTTASTAQLDLDLVVEVDLSDEVAAALAPLLSGSLGALLEAALAPVRDEISILRLGITLQGARASTAVVDIACGHDQQGHVVTMTTNTMTSAQVQIGGATVPIELPSGTTSHTFHAPHSSQAQMTASGMTVDMAAVVAGTLPAVLDGILGGTLTGLLAPLVDPVVDAVVEVMSPVAGQVQHDVFDPMLGALGVSSPTAHVAVLDASCTAVDLVR